MLAGTALERVCIVAYSFELEFAVDGLKLRNLVAWTSLSFPSSPQSSSTYDLPSVQTVSASHFRLSSLFFAPPHYSQEVVTFLPSASLYLSRSITFTPQHAFLIFHILPHLGSHTSIRSSWSVPMLHPRCQRCDHCKPSRVRSTDPHGN